MNHKDMQQSSSVYLKKHSVTIIWKFQILNTDQKSCVCIH